MKEQLKRGYKKPDELLDVKGSNPFMQNYLIPVNKKVIDVINKYGVEDEMENIWDAGRCCKVFEYVGDRVEILRLPMRTKEMLWYIVQSIKSGEDYIWIDKKSYMENMGMASVNTFKSAIKPLMETWLIKMEGVKDVYWVNPARIFKGARITKFSDKLDIKSLIRRTKK